MILINKTSRQHIYVGVFLLFASACVAADSPQTDHIDRDSSGIHITESLRPAWPAGTGWHVKPEPELTIGVEDGDEAYQLYWVGGAVRLNDGRIVIANSGSSELRFYDGDGKHLLSAGGRGEGPGEFHERSTMNLHSPLAGRMLVGDGGNQRVNVYDMTGAFLSSFRFLGGSDAPNVFFSEVLTDGTVIGLAPEGGGSLSGSPGDIIDMAFRYDRYGTDGALINRLMRFVGRRRYVHQTGGIIHYPFIPLTVSPQLASVGETAILLQNGEPQLQLWSSDGSLSSLVRWSPTQRPRTEEIWTRFKNESLNEMPDNYRQRYAHFFDEDLPLPESVPVADRVMVDSDGAIWTRRYRLPWSEKGRWDVFDVNRSWLGVVQMPSDVRVLEIGSDYVLGRHLDSLRVERVVLHQLRKSPD